MSYTININDNQVLIKFEKSDDEKYYNKILDMKGFVKWSNNIDKEFKINNILIQSVDMFGPRIGFLKFKAEYLDKENMLQHGIIFMRGASVAILFEITCIDTLKKYTLLTIQPRFPIGKYYSEEIPAGMLDDSDDFVGVAAKEVEEEVGIIINSSNMIKLGDISMSPGGSDESLCIFLYRMELDEKQIMNFEGKLTGNLKEGEKITLKIILMDNLYKIHDSKTLSALALYKSLY